MPAYWGIAGYPISHSLTPRLFSLVGNHLGLHDAIPVFLESRGINEFTSRVDELGGELWVSCTAPLKHSPQERLGVSGPEGVDAINQLKRKDGVWSGTSTDGVGFIAACRHIGVEPEGCVLRIRGGGSAARAIAAAWAAEGGLIVAENGRRPLVSGPWDSAIIESGDAVIGIDLDAAPGGGDSARLDSEIQVSISYGDGAKTDSFAVIMVAAQHLEAWKLLFAPDRVDELPSLSLLLGKLSAPN